MKNIILAGNAVTAEILHSYLSKDKRYNVVAATVDDGFANKGGVKGLETIPFSALKSKHDPKNCAIVMAMGYNDINRSRESMFNRLKEMGYQIESYIHPASQIHTDHPLGEGCVVLPSAVIEPHVQVGKNSMIWAHVTLAHHSSVADHCWIASGAVISGQARIERNAFIGVNATVVNEVTVAEYTIVGAGALITKNTKPSSVHLARSAETLRYSSQDYVKYFGV